MVTSAQQLWWHSQVCFLARLDQEAGLQVVFHFPFGGMKCSCFDVRFDGCLPLHSLASHQTDRLLNETLA